MSNQQTELTPLQRQERLALLTHAPFPPKGTEQAILDVVSALRSYRAMVTKALSQRYRDGECDAVALFNLEHEQAAVEQLEQPW